MRAALCRAVCFVLVLGLCPSDLPLPWFMALWAAASPSFPAMDVDSVSEPASYAGLPEPGPAPPPAAASPQAERLRCPVPGCPAASAHGHQGWANLACMQGHVNMHLGGQLQGTVPEPWLRRHNKGRCRVCGLLVAASRGVHPRCRPAERQANGAQGASSVQGPALGAAGLQAPSVASLPSLAEVHQKRVPTLKHVPTRCRRLWARCLIRCLAAVVFFNSVAAWTELEMLPKCVLCSPPRRGKSHANAAELYSSDRLSRWLAGERASLWSSIPPGRSVKANNSDEARLVRSEALAREGFDRKATAALTSAQLVAPTQDAAAALGPLHPPAAVPACPPMDDCPWARWSPRRLFGRLCKASPRTLRLARLTSACSTWSTRALLLTRLLSWSS